MAYDVAADPRLDPRQQAEVFRGLMEMCDTEETAPSAGLRVHTEKVISEPDGSSINLQVISPDNDETLTQRSLPQPGSR